MQAYTQMKSELSTLEVRTQKLRTAIAIFDELYMDTEKKKTATTVTTPKTRKVRRRKLFDGSFTKRCLEAVVSNVPSGETFTSMELASILSEGNEPARRTFQDVCGAIKSLWRQKYITRLPNKRDSKNSPHKSYQYVVRQ